MKTKKEQAQNKRDVIDRFLSILWRKEVGSLKYTTKQKQMNLELLKDLWDNQPNTVIGVGVATLSLLGIYIKLLDIYQQ